MRTVSIKDKENVVGSGVITVGAGGKVFWSVRLPVQVGRTLKSNNLRVGRRSITVTPTHCSNMPRAGISEDQACRTVDLKILSFTDSP
jgi:hypothetical protein